jgi:hypothetical protein
MRDGEAVDTAWIYGHPDIGVPVNCGRGSEGIIALNGIATDCNWQVDSNNTDGAVALSHVEDGFR